VDLPHTVPNSGQRVDAHTTFCYVSWGQVAGYSDGDGGILLNPGKYTVGIALDWADTYRPQLIGIRQFLLQEKLRPSREYPLGGKKPVWHLRLSVQMDVFSALKEMLPFLIKKRDQALASERYLQDKITGEDLIEAFNDAIRNGTRSGYIRHLEMPYTHSQGLAKGKEFLKLGPGSPRRSVGPPDFSFKKETRCSRPRWRNALTLLGEPTPLARSPSS
jgi:hypothetical protein